MSDLKKIIVGALFIPGILTAVGSVFYGIGYVCLYFFGEKRFSAYYGPDFVIGGFGFTIIAVMIIALAHLVGESILTNCKKKKK
jgi:hypothetical protein